ncbi:MAG: hypothetical protein JRJ29_19000 [Deltaproteobacteria bacterium]|nr:hypothetical protein [Deltaproteobacteria bacterium]
MEPFKERLALMLAETGALFFDEGLVLKDGRPTPYFVNTAVFRTGRLSLALGGFFAEMLLFHGLAQRADILLGPSYKGSAIALSTAMALWEEHGHDLLVDYDRKEAKVHGEASRHQSLFVNSTLFDGCRIVVLDDVDTSMATKYELLEKLDQEARSRGISYTVLGVVIAVDREQTSAVYDPQGRLLLGCKGVHAVSEFTKKTGIPVYAVVGIREVVGFLYKQRVPLLISGQRRPMDRRTKEAFDGYLETYGAA